MKRSTMHSMRWLPFHARRVGIGLGVLLLALVILEFNTRLDELNKLTEERDLIRIQATQSILTQLALQTAVAYGESGAAVEAWARSDGHYIIPGDQPVVPLAVPGGAARPPRPRCPGNPSAQLDGLARPVLR
jgi:hypothetical protein